jgi:hypothetical protein
MSRDTLVVMPKPTTPWVIDDVVPTPATVMISLYTSTSTIGRTAPNGVVQVVAAVLPRETADRP